MHKSPLRLWAEEQVVNHMHSIRGSSAFIVGNRRCTRRPEENLVPNLKMEDFWSDLADGAGDELRKFSAAYSSSALAVNTFGPFRRSPHLLSLLGYQGFEEAQFEKKLPTGLTRSPHIDFFASGSKRIVCVESKFLETLDQEPSEFADSYERIIGTLAEPCWYELYREMKTNKWKYRWLYAAQLLKHYLGMRNTFGTTCPRLTLLYVYWEPTNAAEIDKYLEHRKEVADFADAIRNSLVGFVHRSYDELWSELEAQAQCSTVRAHISTVRRYYTLEFDAESLPAEAGPFSHMPELMLTDSG